MSAESIHLDPNLLSHLSPRVAPRSLSQFRIGPPFGTTIEVSPLFIKSSNLKLNPIILARIDRGFDYEGNGWVGYKRNYFSLVATFHFESFKSSVSLLQKQGFYLTIKGEHHDIKRFAIRLVSRNVEDNEEVVLVQHTAKRTIGVTPSIIYAIPGLLPSHTTVKQSFNVRNCEKLERLKLMFVTKYNHIEIKNSDSILHNYRKGELFTTVAKYERIQFTTSTGRNRSLEKSKIIVQVQLLAELEEEDSFAVVAVANTPPLTMRGRSPSSYTNVEPKTSLKKVNNVSSYFNTTPQYVSSPLSQGLHRFDQENSAPYSDGYLNSGKEIDPKCSEKASSSSENSKESSMGCNNVTFSNTIDKLVQFDPIYSLTGEELDKQFSSSSFSDGYFTHSEGIYDITTFQDDNDHDICIVPDLVFRG